MSQHRVVLGKLADLPSGTAKRFDVDNRRIAVVRCDG